MEAAYKISADINDRISTNIKTCIGCHGFEVDQAFGTAYISDYLNIDAGRINVPFGAFNESHDPANYKMATKPLPYMMGHMVRQGDYELGVVPMPFVDNGVSLYGTAWPTSMLSVFYAVYFINGFHSYSINDINWSEKWTSQQNLGGDGKDLFPAAGGRLGITYGNFSLGSSFNYGEIDHTAGSSYSMVGADLQVQLQKLCFKSEYVRRRTSLPDPVLNSPKYGLVDSFFIKQGGYFNIEYQLSKNRELLYSIDFLHRSGNLIAGSPLTYNSKVVRNRLGYNVAFGSGLVLKFNLEYWNYSDFASEIAIRTGSVYSF